MANYNINAVTRRVVYTGSAGTGPYSFTFEVLVQTDLAVYFNSTKLTLTTDYTVTINANGTGSITIVTGTNVPSTPTGSDTITIIGARDIERTTDFVTAGELRAAALNEQLDALTIFDQQIAEENKRQPIAPEYDPAHVDDGGTLDMTLPAKASRLGKLLGFNSSTGNPEATTGRVLTVNVSDVAVDGGGNSQPATVSYSDSTGALSLGIPTGSTGATGATGSTGAAGSDGTDGVGGLPYTFSTTTSDADPGAGQIRLNNATLGSVSQIFIDDSSAASGNPDVSAFILTWDDSTQTSDRGQVTITKKSAQENFATYKISGASTDASGYVKLAVTHVVSNGSFSNSDAVLVSFVRTGNAGSLADPMTTRGDIIVRDSSNATARLAVGSANTVLKSDGTDPSWGYTVGTSANNLVQLNGSAELPAVSGANLTNLAASLPRGHLSGLELSNGTDADHDIDISAGECRGIDDDEDITLSAFTKQIDATWAAGTNAGGLASGVSLTNDTWYHVFAINVGGAADVGFDTSVTGATLVSAHSATAVRRIGCVKTDGSANILAFHQRGDFFEWDSHVADVNASNPGSTEVTATISTPLGIAVNADIYGWLRDLTPALGTNASVYSPDLSAAQTLTFAGTEIDSESVVYQTVVTTNTSSQVKYKLSSSTADHNFKISTRGWWDTRGRDD